MDLGFYPIYLDWIGSDRSEKMAWKRRSDPIHSMVLQIGSRSDPDPEKLDLDPDLGAWIGDPVHHWFFP